MRELKYRVWSVDDRTYDDPYSHSYYAMTQDGKLDFYCHGDHWDSCEPDKYIIEQYTGLIDKNGKEIYEGDIVKTNSPDRANFNAGAIVMQQQMYLIINTPTYGDARLSHSEPLGYYCDMECEIIGNIHENPELLGDEE